VVLIEYQPNLTWHNDPLITNHKASLAKHWVLATDYHVQIDLVFYPLSPPQSAFKIQQLQYNWEAPYTLTDSDAVNILRITLPSLESELADRESTRYSFPRLHQLQTAITALHDNPTISEEKNLLLFL
jgi:hypothetical protein